jgi:hypothetical protein
VLAHEHLHVAHAGRCPEGHLGLVGAQGGLEAGAGVEVGALHAHLRLHLVPGLRDRGADGRGAEAALGEGVPHLGLVGTVEAQHVGGQHRVTRVDEGRVLRHEQEAVELDLVPAPVARALGRLLEAACAAALELGVRGRVRASYFLASAVKMS